MDSSNDTHRKKAISIDVVIYQLLHSDSIPGVYRDTSNAPSCQGTPHVDHFPIDWNVAAKRSEMCVMSREKEARAGWFMRDALRSRHMAAY